MSGEMKELTIAQALRRVKDLKGKVAKHNTNASMNVTHKTKNSPAFAFGAEAEAAAVAVEEMIDLQTRIAVANAKTMVDVAGKTRVLSWCTKKLAEIKGAIAWYASLGIRAQDKTTEEELEWVHQAGSGPEHVRVSTEYTCHLPEAARAACIQKLETEFAELNDVVETINHRTFV